MAQHRVIMKLNQQQLELLDRTIEQGIAPDRASLIRLALHEYAARHQPDARASLATAASTSSGEQQ
ncbi:hypothetical protein BH11PSE11_BH11PSE11_23630 [soil metagenome]